MAQSLEYAVTVFDTAPTGHTIRLLNMPDAFGKGITKVLELKNQFGGMISQVVSVILNIRRLILVFICFYLSIISLISPPLYFIPT